MGDFWVICKFCKKQTPYSKAIHTADGAYCSHDHRAMAANAPAPLIAMPKKDPTVKASRAQERRVAMSMGGRVTMASGALPGGGGDAENEEWLSECKRTDKKQITITVAVLDKLTVEASRAGRKPRLDVEVGGQEWVAVPRAVFDGLVEGE